MDPGRLDAAPARGGPQRIPRPDSFRLGPGAPWAAPGSAPTAVTVAMVRQAFAGTRPLDVSEDEVVDRRVLETAPVAERETANRPAAVLCAVFEGEGGQAHVVLTRRSARMRSHTGEVSLPGGRLEPGETPVVAALREAEEEVGIDPGSVEVVGRLSAVSTRRNPSAITPFVGILPAPPVLRPNDDEVDRAFTVPLVELYGSDCYHEELWEGPDGSERSISIFEVIGDTVWGATGRMLSELLDRIWSAGVAGGPRNPTHAQ